MKYNPEVEDPFPADPSAAVPLNTTRRNLSQDAIPFCTRR